MTDAMRFIRDKIDHPIPGAGSMREYAENYIRQHTDEFVNLPPRLAAPKQINAEFDKTNAMNINAFEVKKAQDAQDAKVAAINKSLFEALKSMPQPIKTASAKATGLPPYGPDNPIPLGTPGTVLLRDGPNKGQVTYGYYDDKGNFMRRQPTTGEQIIMDADKFAGQVKSGIKDDVNGIFAAFEKPLILVAVIAGLLLVRDIAK